MKGMKEQDAIDSIRGKTLEEYFDEVLKCTKTLRPQSKFAQEYETHFRESYDVYGPKGLSTQILYYLNNVKAKGEEQKKAKKDLMRLSKEIGKL
jgi:ribosomal protein L22